MSRSSKSPNRDVPYKSLPVSEGHSSTTNSGTKEKVKILVRVRPILNTEIWNDNIQIKDDNTIKIIKPDLDSITMQFDEIFTPTAKQSEIFESIEESIERFLHGENEAFFAYGQTGAGKTYSMIGDLPENGSFSLDDMLKNNSRGILPRALTKIMEYVSKNKNSFKLWASFLEIYNEKIYDLLNPKGYLKPNGLELRESNGGSHILDLLQFEIKSIENALECLKLGLKNRATGSTHANTKSSRSHSIFQLFLVQPDPKDPSKTITSKLRIIDLAGSEKFIIPKNISPEEKELRVLELTSINGSLSTLGHCISALTDAKRTHIPFRNSKLTRVLRDSLSGDGKICFIVCISPSLESTNETISTLQFASRAKKIILDGRHLRNKSEKRVGLSDHNSYPDILELLKQVMQKHGMSRELLSDGMKEKIEHLEAELRELREQNEELKNEVKILKRSYSPDLFAKKSSSNFATPQRVDSQKNSGYSSPSRSDHIKQVAHERCSQDTLSSRLSIKSRSKSPYEKRVRFTEDCITEKMKHELEYHDNTIFQNLSIFKDVDLRDHPQKKSLTTEEIQRLKKRNSNSLKFWTYIDDESDEYQEDNPAVLERLIKNRDKSNLLAQRIKQKEVERKYELFFSSFNKEGQSRKNDVRETDTNKINSQKASLKQFDADNSYLSSKPESSIVDYHIGKPLNNETFNSLSSLRDDNKISETLNFNETQLLHYKLHEDTMGTLGNHDISSIMPRQLRHNEASEEEPTTGQNTYRSMHDAIEQEYRSSNDSVMLQLRRRLHDSIYQSEAKETEREIDNKSEEILKEFDKKLNSVHELNKKHQELIKNLDSKMAEFQKASLSDLKYYEVNKSLISSKKNTSYEKLGYEVAEVVKELKKEVSDALIQIQNLQTENITDTKDHNSQSWSSAKSSHSALERRTYMPGNSQPSGPKEKTENNYKSSKDIIRQHWSSFKENFKMIPPSY